MALIKYFLKDRMLGIRKINTQFFLFCYASDNIYTVLL